MKTPPKNPPTAPIPVEHRTVVLAHNALHAVAEFYGDALREVTESGSRNSAMLQQMGAAMREQAKLSAAERQDNERNRDLADKLLKRSAALRNAIDNTVGLISISACEPPATLDEVVRMLKDALDEDDKNA